MSGSSHWYIPPRKTTGGGTSPRAEGAGAGGAARGSGRYRKACNVHARQAGIPVKRRSPRPSERGRSEGCSYARHLGAWAPLPCREVPGAAASLMLSSSARRDDDHARVTQVWNGRGAAVLAV